MTNNDKPPSKQGSITVVIGCVLGELALLAGVVAAYKYFDIDFSYDFLSPVYWLIVIVYILVHYFIGSLLLKNNLITKEDIRILYKLNNVFGYTLELIIFSSISFLFVMGKVDSLIVAGVIAVIMGILCIPIWRKLSINIR